MKIIVPLTILLTSFSQVSGQTADFHGVVISHIFFCIDSATYDNLFKNEFIPDLFANTSESSTKTLTDSWSGKYLNGRRSYIEVFKPTYQQDTELGDKFGDLGIVFRTKKPGDINKIDSAMRSDSRDVHFELMKYESDEKVIPFNNNLYLSNDLENNFRPYAEELTAEFLKICGFSETQINSGVTEEQFREKRRGKKYEKLYDNIEKIELTLTQPEFDYLAKSLQYFGFSQTGYRFTNDKLEIICSVQQDRSYKLKAIYFNLVNSTPNIAIEISKNLSFTASGRKASFQFTVR